MLSSALKRRANIWLQRPRRETLRHFWTAGNTLGTSSQRARLARLGNRSKTIDVHSPGKKVDSRHPNPFVARMSTDAATETAVPLAIPPGNNGVPLPSSVRHQWMAGVDLEHSFR